MKPIPILALFLSIIPGLGHLYAMGSKGIARGVVFLASFGITFWFWLIGIGIIMTAIVWIWCAVDAYGMAKIMQTRTGDENTNLFGV